MSEFQFALHARALVEGRAVRAAEHSHVDLREDAVFVPVLAMHGEPSLLWGCGVGRQNDARLTNGAFKVAGDPRQFSEHLTVWQALGRGFRARFAPNPPEGWFPQVVVATTAGWRHLHAGAERFFTVEDPDARHAAETILWLAERREHAGSQALIVLSEFLSDHYATGEPDNQDRLDVWCKWLGVTDEQRERGRAETEDGAVVEALCDGVDEARTDPMFDSLPVLKAMTKARSLYNVLSAARHASETGRTHQAKAAAGVVSPMLTRVLSARFKRMVKLYKHARGDFPHPISGLSDVAAEDGRSWERWRTSRDGGYYATRRDGVLAATLGLTSREQAADAWERVLVAGDSVAFRRAVHDGRAVRGTVRSVSGGRVEFVTAQPIVRARPGTELVVRGTAEPVLVVDDLTTSGSDTLLLLDGAAGDDTLSPGDEVALIPSPFDWGRAARSRGAAVSRLRNPNWTHVEPDRQAAPLPRSASVPDGLLSRVMERRA